MWSRSGQDAPAPQQPTQRMASAPGAEARPTERIASPGSDAATEFIPRPDTASTPPTTTITGAPQPPREGKPPKESKLRSFLKDPLSITLVLVIVAALAIAGVLGGELFARKRANSIVSQVVSCVVQDEATASFGVSPPFLWQHINKRYTNISIETAGNQIRDAKGMKLNLDINDVRLDETANSGGTIGSMSATVDWSADGIKRSVQDAIPLFGGFLSNVRTNASAGTVELDAGLGSITAKPQVIDGEFKLEVVSLSGLGFMLPSETVQPALDAFTSQLTKDYPMDIKADSVQVTDSGVIAKFSSHNATMPPGTEDPCFAAL